MIDLVSKGDQNARTGSRPDFLEGDLFSGGDVLFPAPTCVGGMHAVRDVNACADCVQEFMAANC